jgi:hypothetical protein
VTVVTVVTVAMVTMVKRLEVVVIVAVVTTPYSSPRMTAQHTDTLPTHKDCLRTEIV